MSDVVEELAARVPDGWNFRRAAEIARTQIRHPIDPLTNTRRLTLCQSLREIWMAADRSSDPIMAAEIKLFTEVAFEAAKRIDRRHKELKRKVGEL